MKTKLEATAKLIRSKLESIQFADQLNYLRILDNFPSGCCKMSAFIYLFYLKNYMNTSPEILYLVANAEIREGVSHAWCRVGKFHVDLTADQFGQEKIIVSANNPWPKLYQEPNEFPFSKEKLAKEYEAELIRVCQYIIATSTPA